MEPISATIITLNEEDNIERCLNSLVGLVDEIIVVDSGSTDHTVDICRRYGCHVVERAFSGYGLQRQFATSLTTHTYILAIDADEALDEELHNHIKRIKSEGFEHRVYAMRTAQYCLGQRVHQPAQQSAPIRLFNKRYAQWNLDDIAERITFPTSLRPVTLKGELLHYRSKTVEQLRRKEYAQARINVSRHTAVHGQPGAFGIAMRTVRAYLHSLLAEGAWRDGKTGRIMSRVKAQAINKAFKNARQQ